MSGELARSLVDAAAEAIASADETIGTTDAAARVAVLAVLETLEADLFANSAACRSPRCAQCDRARIAIADFRRLAAEVKED